MSLEDQMSNDVQPGVADSSRDGDEESPEVDDDTANGDDTDDPAASATDDTDTDPAATDDPAASATDGTDADATSRDTDDATDDTDTDTDTAATRDTTTEDTDAAATDDDIDDATDDKDTDTDTAATDNATDGDTDATTDDTDPAATDTDDDIDDATDDKDTDTGKLETVSAIITTENRTMSDADEDVPATDDTPSTEELAAEVVRLRAEYEVLQRQLDATTKPGPKRIHRPSTYWVSIACVVLGGLLLPLAVLVRWTSNTVLDTDSYVETVAPLAQNEDIQEALSFRVSVIILDAIDFRQQAEDALPTPAGFLAAPIESGVRTLVQDIVDEFVSTEAFERLWEDVNRVGHENVVAVLTGEGTDTLDAENGKVVVRVGPIAEEVLNTLDDILGTDLQNSIPDDRLDGEFVLVDSDDLASLQDEISLFDRLSWLIPILTTALLAASVIISRPRRLAFGRLGIAIVVPMAISLLLYDWIRSQYVGGLPDDIHNPDAAAAFFDITTRFVPRDMRVLLVLGLALLFLTWLFGPTGWAGRARAWWNTILGRVGDKSEDHDVGAAPKWVADNERTLFAFAVALGVLTLLVWTRPTGLVVLTVIVAVALVMAATSLIAEVGKRAESADEERLERDATGAESSDAGQLTGTGSGATEDQAESGE
jgi:hypothetical protein